jgi:hypothetical protein
MSKLSFTKLHVLLMLCILQASCTTHLESSKLDPAKAQKYNAYLDGIHYSLPKTQLLLKATYRIVSCNQNAEINVKLEASSSAIPDPNHHYVIDKDALNSWTKSTSLKVEYHPNMMIKSINATADDKVAPIIADVVSTVAKVATVAAAAAGVTPSEACLPTVATAVKKVSEAELNIKSVTKMLELFELDITYLRGVKAEKGDKWDAADKEKYLKLLNEYHEASRLLATSKTDLQENLKKISFERNITWSPNADEFLFTQLTGSVPVFDGLDQNDPDVAAALSVSTKNLRDGKFIKDTEIYVKMVNPSMLQTKIAVESTKSNSPFMRMSKDCELQNCFDVLQKSDFEAFKITGDKEKKIIGFVYRYPSVATLDFCSTLQCNGTDNKHLATYSGALIQLGKLQAISLKSPPFTNRKFAATFSEDGAPTMLEFSADSSGQNIAAAVKGAVTSASEIYTGEKGKELKSIQNETTLLKAKKDLKDLKLSLVETPKTDDQKTIANFNEETLLISAEVQYIKAKNELEKLLSEGK